MAYETVYKIPSGIIEGEKGKRFVRKDNLQELVESSEKFSMLYFVRKSEYDVHEYPYISTRLVSTLRRSKIRGPFESAPEKLFRKRSNWVDEYSINELYSEEEELLRKLIPTRKMPLNLEDIMWVEYGTNHFVISFSVHHIETDVEGLIQVGRGVLNYLSQFRNEKVSTTRYKGLINDCLVDFYFDPEVDFSEEKIRKACPEYPKVNIKILGKIDTIRKIINDSGVQNIEPKINPHRGNGGCPALERVVVEGLAYDLDLNSMIDKEISNYEDLRRIENIIV